MTEIDRLFAQKQLARGSKIQYSLDKHSEMSNTEFIKRIEEQVNSFYTDLLEKQIVEQFVEQSKDIEVNYNLSSLEKELTNLFANLGNKH